MPRRVGRPPLRIPRKHVSLYLRVDLLATLELILADPVRDRAKYGERSAYIEALIERDLEQRRADLTTDTDARTIPDRHESGPNDGNT